MNYFARRIDELNDKNCSDPREVHQQVECIASLLRIARDDVAFTTRVEGSGELWRQGRSTWKRPIPADPVDLNEIACFAVAMQALERLVAGLEWAAPEKRRSVSSARWPV